MGKSREEQFIRHEYQEITFYVLFGIVMAILLPIFAGFFLGGFSETFVEGRAIEFTDVLFRYMIYYIMIIAGLIGLPILKFRELLLTKAGENVARQKNPAWFAVAYIHDPEIDGALYNLFQYLKVKKNPMRWSVSMFRTLVIFSIIFAIVGVGQAVSSTQFTSIPQVSFEVTKSVEVLFAAEPPAFAETTTMLIVFCLLMGINAYLVSRFKLPVITYWVIGFLLICPFMGLTWMGFHTLVYGTSEIALFVTFIFGWLGSTLTLLFGSFIPWYAWHFWNNVYAKLTEVVTSNADVVFVSVVAIVIVTFFYILGEILVARIRKKNEIPIINPSF